MARTTSSKLTYPQSTSGYWSVALSAPVTIVDHRYLPGFDAITVDEPTLVAMLTEGAVAHVAAA